MLKSDNRKHLLADDYFDLVEDFRVLTQAILLLIAPLNKSKKDLYISYTLSRSMVLLESISTLWKNHHYNDCWILYRAQLDRLLHMYHLNDYDEVEAFNDWSFIKSFELRNNIKSEEQLKGHLNEAFWNEPKGNVEKYKRLKKSSPIWKRPNLERVAKSRGVEYLYKFGYDVASGYVHPLATDGDFEFELLTEINQNNKFSSDQSAILHNAIATFLRVLHEGLTSSRYKWRKEFFDYVDAVQIILIGNESDHKLILYSILKMFKAQDKLLQE